MNPGFFRPLDDLKADIDAFVRYLEETPPAEGFTEVLYPGELEYRTEQQRRRDGIPIEDETWRQIGKVAERFGLSELMQA